MQRNPWCGHGQRCYALFEIAIVHDVHNHHVQHTHIRQNDDQHQMEHARHDVCRLSAFVISTCPAPMQVLLCIVIVCIVD